MRGVCQGDALPETESAEDASLRLPTPRGLSHYAPRRPGTSPGPPCTQGATHMGPAPYP